MRYCFAFVSLMAAALASAAIHGTVRDSSGAPVPRARVYLLKPPQPARVVTADSAGVFQISETTSGVCTIFASAPGLTGDKVEIPCESATIALALHPSAVSETIVVTANRAELPSSAVASSVSVLTPEDLSALQAFQLFEALRYLPGVEVNQTGRRGGVTGLFVRGADSKYNLVKVNGVTVNDFGGAYNFASLPAEEIEQVELVRGPQSALYGSYAIGSAVQIVTPSGLDRHDFSASAEGGNFGARRFTVGGGGELRRLGIYAGASRLETDGVVANDDSRIDNAYLKLDHRLDPHRLIEYALVANSNESGNPGAFGSDPARLFGGLDRVTRTFENYDIHSFRFDSEIGERVRQRIMGSLYSGRLDFHSPFGPAFSRNSRESFGSETSYALAGHDLLIFGAEWQHERFRFETSPVRRNIYGWFAENHFEAAKRLFLNIGVRAEYVRLGSVPAPAFFPRPAFAPSSVTQVHPKISAAVLARKSTRLHGSFGTGLRPPNGFELAFTTNPELKPERTVSFDAGLQQSLFGERVAADVTYFYNRFRDQIVTLSPAQAALSRWSSDNLANSEAKGIEVSLSLRAGHGVRLRGAYTYLDSEILKLNGSSAAVQRSFRLGQQLLRRPRHAGSYLAIWQHRRLLVETGAVLRGRTLDIEPNLAAGQFLNPFYATFDAGAQLEIHRGLALTAKVRNLLDRTYEESLGFPALGRNFTVGMRFRGK